MAKQQAPPPSTSVGTELSGVLFYTNLDSTRTSITITFPPAASSTSTYLEFLYDESSWTYYYTNVHEYIDNFKYDSVLSYSPLPASTTPSGSSSSSSSTSTASIASISTIPTASGTSSSTFAAPTVTSTVTTSPEVQADGGTRFSPGAIAGLVIGLVVAVAALTFISTIGALRYRRHKREQSFDPTSATKTEDDATAVQGDGEEPSTLVESDPYRQ